MKAFLLVAFAAAALAVPVPAPGFSWDLDLALFARDMSRSAYCGEASIAAWNCLTCTSKDFVVKHVISETKNPGKLQGFIGYSDSFKAIVVSFRGSQNLVNWVRNACFAKVDHDLNDQGCDNCKVHNGWYLTYQEVAAEVLAVVNELAVQFPDYTILTTGHSLGAAVAVHTAVDLCVNHNLTHRLDMITFGEPRLGNENFAKFASAVVPGSTRIVHLRDIVAHLPPHEGLLPFDFHHEATEVWNKDKAYTVQICDGSGEDDNCSKSVSLFRWSIFDHLWSLGAPTGCKVKNDFTEAEIEELKAVEKEIISYTQLQQQK